jgi:hypothetical protein
MERPVAFGQRLHIGARAALDLLHGRKLGDDLAIAGRWMQQRATAGWSRLVVELDNVLLELTNPVNHLATRPRALSPASLIRAGSPVPSYQTSL